MFNFMPFSVTFQHESGEPALPVFPEVLSDDRFPATQESWPIVLDEQERFALEADDWPSDIEIPDGVWAY